MIGPAMCENLSHFAERVALGLGDLESAQISQPTNRRKPAEAMEQREARLIRDALSANHGDVRTTIEALGIPRKTSTTSYNVTALIAQTMQDTKP